MFVDFYYLLKENGIPVTPTSFLRLHKALHLGVINSIDDFYIGARAILVKSEKHFDSYDRIFAHHFRGADLPDPQERELAEIARLMLDEWLKDPAGVARALGVSAEKFASMTADELMQYFLDRLKEQTGEHHGGGKWIGTRGTSPVGHSGYHPGGMRIGGSSMNRSAVKTALDRRYRDYSQEGPMTTSQMGEALKRLRHMAPAGPKDRINIDATIYETMKKAGEIEIVFERGLRDRLKVIIAIDNGGWSMEPYVALVQTLFSYSRAQFKELKTLFFHNTVYTQLWEDAQRHQKPLSVSDLARFDPETRFIFIGDASMAPEELLNVNGSIRYNARSGKPSIEQLRFIATTFPHAVWINPAPKEWWNYTYTVKRIREVFPMFELTLDGLEKAVGYLTEKRPHHLNSSSR